MSVDGPSEQRRQKLRDLREALAISQLDLAVRVGVSESTIRNFERNRRSSRAYPKIAAVLRAAQAERLGLADAATLIERVGVSPYIAGRILAAEPIHEEVGRYADAILEVEEARYREAARKAVGASTTDEDLARSDAARATEGELFREPEVRGDVRPAASDRDDEAGIA